jgi:DNA repair exonuclease SbcCD ATPase subunit
MMPPNSRESARVQPQLLTTQDADVINNQLLRAGEAIEVSRQKLFETRYVASEALQELDQERQIRQRCSDAYKELHVQYERKVDEVFEMTTKCLKLNEELEKAQKAISNYDSTLKESERGIAAEKAQLEARIRDLEGRRTRIANHIQNVLEDEQSARRRIGELEKEKENLIREHGKTINVMAAREALAIQRADELQKGVDKFVQEHQAAMNIAVDRMNSAEEMADALRKKYERWEACPTPSPQQSLRVGKRRKPEPEPTQQPVRPSKYRKCKRATKVGDDTIVVKN